VALQIFFERPLLAGRLGFLIFSQLLRVKGHDMVRTITGKPGPSKRELHYFNGNPHALRI
jgi:hypothetical protein